jgi:hypothetical protein
MERRGEVAAGAVPPDQATLRAVSTRDLVKLLARKASRLARKEVALVKSEAKENLRSEIKMASGLGIAGVCALVTLQMLLVALVLGLAEGGVLPGWGAALLVAAVVLAIGTVAALVGWAKRVRTPLESARKSARENVRWVKERAT